MPNFLAQGVAPPDIAGQQRNALAMGMDLETQNMRRELFQQERADSAQKRMRADMAGVGASVLLAPQDQWQAIYQQGAAEFNKRYPNSPLPPSLNDPREALRIYAEGDPDGMRKLVESRLGQKPQGLTTVSPGGVVYDQDARQPIYTAPRAPGSDESWSNPVDEVGEDGRPIRVRYSNRGNRQVIQGAQPAPKRGLTIDPDTGQMVVAQGGGVGLKEGEGKAVTYGIRAAAGLEKLEQIEDSGYDPSNLSDRAAENLPGGNFMLSKGGQQYRQAASEFLAAILRKDTGAAVTKEEWNIYGEQFFPRAGDTPEVIQQKRQARRTAMEALRAGSGAGAPMIPQTPQQPQQPRTGNFREGATATNPQTGEKLIYRGGQWVPAQ